ncbi:MAG: peptide deformylase [Patescibacteria group bacterium]
MEIWIIKNKDQEKFLRRKTADFDFSKYSLKEIKDLIKKMRAAMKKANGIGLSANQVGLNLKLFIARVDNKFYSIFNPKITKFSEETFASEEGCLSVPEIFGPTKRAEKITLEGQDTAGKKIKIKAWGLLAKVFQHEVDHLNGLLFIDKATELYKIQIAKSKTQT